MAERRPVVIVGAGPAGLLLGRLLEQAGVDALVVEARDRAYVEARQRAGILEQGTMDLLEQAGVGQRMLDERLLHDGVEVLFDGVGHRIDLHALTGRRVAIYAQTEVVKDLLAAREASGAETVFEAQDVRVEPEGGTVGFTHAGERREVRADVVAGCDGFHGVCRPLMAGGAVLEKEYPFSWLGILARARPCSDELIYASHSRGFALASMRSESIVRLYLQVPNGTDLADWPDDRIWAELERRLARDEGGHGIERGEIFDRGVTPMRSYVGERMRRGRLVLAGDSAHIVPPTGAKGLNLAVRDVAVLSRAVIDHLQGDAGALDAYVERALRAVWRAEHFSWWMTSTLHSWPDADDFDRGLQRSQLEYLSRSEAAQTSFAENYVGLPM